MLRRAGWLCVFAFSTVWAGEPPAEKPAGKPAAPQPAAAEKNEPAPIEPAPIEPARPSTPEPQPTTELIGSLPPKGGALDPLPPSTRFTFTNLVVLRVNPLGLEDQIRAGFQFLLYEHVNKALRDNFVFFG